MTTEVIDDIRVGVIHGPAGKIEPVWFDLNRRQHRIRQITNCWRERQGTDLYLHFHVVDSGALYELIYCPAKGCWRLVLIEILT